MRAQRLHSVKGQPVSDVDNGIPDTTTVCLTPFVDDQMFQRWLVMRVHQRKEMEFERGDLPPVIGYLTGMDDQFYSVSTTSEFPPRSRILPRSSVTMVSETNRSLHELDQRTEVLIKRYTAAIHREAAEQRSPSLRMAGAARQVSDRPRQNSL